MRELATAALVAFAITASGQTSTTTAPAPKKPAATTPAATMHRPIASTPRAPMAVDSKASEGIAAVGTMPAATGPSKSLFALRYVDLKIGDGELAKASTPENVMFYTVHYTGWLTDGTKFDSSVDRGEPITMPIGVRRVIAGWDAGFEGMHVGGRRRLIVPWQLAYGEAGRPPVIPAKADLIFDIELISQTSQNDMQKPAAAAPPAGNPAAQPAERPEEHPE